MCNIEILKLKIGNIETINETPINCLFWLMYFCNQKINS